MSKRFYSVLALVVYGVVVYFATARLWDREINGNTTINFHGRVLDPDGNGIPGVEISGVITRGVTYGSPRYGDFRGEVEVPFHATSGTDGRFEVLNSRGCAIGVRSFKSEDTWYERVVDSSIPNAALLYRDYDYSDPTSNGVALPDSITTEANISVDVWDPQSVIRERSGRSRQ